MSENQNIEYKLIWKDEYFKQICAFANADGGVLLIGVDDKANAIGITDSAKLLENIPNKAIQFLGIIINVNSIIKEKKAILEIKVFPNTVPISYKGKYYTRSGSTVQEVKGQELHSFILKKIGKTFDELVLDNASLKDIDANSIKSFVNRAILTTYRILGFQLYTFPFYCAKKKNQNSGYAYFFESCKRKNYFVEKPKILNEMSI